MPLIASKQSTSSMLSFSGHWFPNAGSQLGLQTLLSGVADIHGMIGWLLFHKGTGSLHYLTAWHYTTQLNSTCHTLLASQMQHTAQCSNEMLRHENRSDCHVEDLLSCSVGRKPLNVTKQCMPPLTDDLSVRPVSDPQVSLQTDPKNIFTTFASIR